MQKRKMEFRIRLFVNMSFNIVVILTALILAFAVFYYFRSVLKNNLFVRLHDLSYAISKSIDGDKFIQIKSKDDTQSRKLYQDIKTGLDTMHKTTTNIFYIYTLKLNSDNKPVFAVIHDEDRGFMGWWGEVLNEFPDEAMPLFKKQGIVVKKEFYTDDFGTWVSGYATITDSKNRPVGVVGIDVSVEDIRKSEQRVLLIIAIITSLTIIGVIILSIYFSNMITRPLLVLEEQMRHIQSFDLRDVEPLNSIFIEISRMENTVANTIKALRSFKRYVPAELVHQIVTKEMEANLSGENTEATFLFTDIADFTTISESVNTELLVDKMGGYFEGMISTIHSYGGTVDKYIGDAIMAFWGAPRPVEDHQLQTCLAADKCLKFLNKFNRRLEAEGFPRFDTRFGIHCGKAIIGNMGYSDRLNYTAIGDTVNLASRLESLNKYYGTSFIISETVKAAVSEHFILRKLDRIIVKGKTEPISIYEMLGLKNEADQIIDIDFAELFNLAMEDYYNRLWKKAANNFARAHKIRPHDTHTKKMYRICVAFDKEQPDKAWDGIVKFDEK
jgi:adenylate cyclase